MTEKAWKVTHEEFPNMVSIHKAGDRHQARYKSLVNAREAGYELKYTKVKAVRAPEFDHLPDPPHFTSVGWADGMDSYGCMAMKDIQETA